MMTKYTTEKRKANVGERILITKGGYSGDTYGNGDVLTVIKDRGSLGVNIKEYPTAPFIWDEEYEVIIADKPSKSARISQLESKVAALESEVKALQKPKTTVQNVSVNLVGEKSAITAEQISEAMRKFASTARTATTPNQQRKAVIERAKAFVAEQFIEGNYGVGKVVDRFCGHNTVNFVVNVQKRTVVAILSLAYVPGEVRGRGIAKCAPDDVFNADIGKAIALGRALGLDVSEFENAVKPTEITQYHVINSAKYGKHIVTPGDDQERIHNMRECGIDSPVAYASTIIDDTKAKY